MADDRVDPGAVLLSSLADPAAIIERDPSGLIRLRRGNGALALALDRQLGELPGVEVDRLFADDGEARIPGCIRRALDEQCEVAYDVRRERPHGRYHYLGTVTPVSATQVVLVERDVSDERRALQRLEEIEALTETGTWSWNLVSGGLEWSAEFRRIVGVGPGFEPHAEVVFDVVHHEDRGHVRRAMRDARDAGTTEEFTYRVVRPSGEVRTVCGRASRAVDSEGKPIRLFGTMQDVTQRRALELSEEARSRMVRQQDRAMQLNDDVLQSLARAWLALDLERPDEVRRAVDEGMATVRRMMADLLHASGSLHGVGRGLQPGQLAHLRAAREEREHRDGVPQQAAGHDEDRPDEDRHGPERSVPSPDER